MKIGGRVISTAELGEKLNELIDKVTFESLVDEIRLSLAGEDINEMRAYLDKTPLYKNAIDVWVRDELSTDKNGKIRSKYIMILRRK